GLLQSGLPRQRPDGEHLTGLRDTELDRRVVGGCRDDPVAVERVVEQRPVLAPHGDGVVRTHFRFLSSIRGRPDPAWGARSGLFWVPRSVRGDGGAVAVADGVGGAGGVVVVRVRLIGG